jgi:hypothetical protein
MKAMRTVLILALVLLCTGCNNASPDSKSEPVSTSTGLEQQATIASSSGAGLYEPYAAYHLNFFYNLLFCDDLGLYKRASVVAADDPWKTLLAESPDKTALRRIADDETKEGRVRALAYNRLRAAGEPVPAKKVLGVIAEFPLKHGLDVVAAFSDGSVRYVHGSGKSAVFEGPGNPVEDLAKALMDVSQPVVEQIDLWDQRRLPPPQGANARLTFLASDGFYFGEGPLEALRKDPLSGPVLSKAARLLERADELGTK